MYSARQEAAERAREAATQAGLRLKEYVASLATAGGASNLQAPPGDTAEGAELAGSVPAAVAVDALEQHGEGGETLKHGEEPERPSEGGELEAIAVAQA